MENTVYNVQPSSEPRRLSPGCDGVNCLHTLLSGSEVCCLSFSPLAESGEFHPHKEKTAYVCDIQNYKPVCKKKREKKSKNANILVTEVREFLNKNDSNQMKRFTDCSVLDSLYRQ